jgi:hypothetical protein
MRLALIRSIISVSCTVIALASLMLLLPQATAAHRSTAPQALSLTPATGAYLNTVPVTIDVDPGGITVTAVEFSASFDNGAGRAWQVLGVDNTGGDGWQYVWDTSAITDQAGITLAVRATDTLNSVLTAASGDLTLDRTPPTATLKPLPPAIDYSIIIFEWLAGDNLSGLSHYDIQVQRDGGEWTDWALNLSTDYTDTWYYGLLNHTYGFRMRAVDRAGNASDYPTAASITTTLLPCTAAGFESDDTFAAASVITLSAPALGHNLCGIGDHDWVKFFVQADQVILIRTRDLGAPTDTILTLYAGDGLTQLAENDDIIFNQIYESQIVWRAASTGWLYARVRDWEARLGGNAVTYKIELIPGYLNYLPLIRRS